MELTSGGHARHAADVKVIKSRRFLFQPLKIWRNRAVISVGGQQAFIQRIKHQHYCFHFLFSLITRHVVSLS
jgi:hypothetical protein